MELINNEISLDPWVLLLIGTSSMKYKILTRHMIEMKIASLQAGSPFGVCKNIAVSNTTSATNPAGSFSGSVQLTGSASKNHFPNLSVFCLFHVFFMLSLLYQT